MAPAVIISGESVESREALGTALEAGLKQTDLNTEDIGVHTGDEHDEWEPGEPCPECGSDRISVMVLSEDIEHHDHQQSEFLKKGDTLGPALSHTCAECLTHLDHLPYEKFDR